MSARPAPEPVVLAAAPSPWVPLGFMVPGVALLFGSLAALPFLAGKLTDWYYQQEVLAAVHTLTLGFVLSVFLGATAQLLPVLAGGALRRTRLVGAANVLFLAGAAGMVAHFWRLRWPGILGSALMVVLAVALFFAATVPLLLKARGDAVRLGFLLAFAGLLLTMSAGLLIGWNRHHPFLPGAPLGYLGAHLHLGLLATFTVAIFGVESKLLPLFLLGEPPVAGRQALALWLTWGGAVAIAAALCLGWPAAPFAALPAAGLALQVIGLAGVLRSRRRRQIDAGFRYALSAYLDLALALVVGLAWALGLGAGTALPIRLAWVYVYLLLVGFVIQTVIGILSKILPFLVWQSTYARRAGLFHVPTLRELSSERLQTVGFWLFRAATLLFVLALLRGRLVEIRVLATFQALALIPFVLHTARVLFHLARPLRLRPISMEVPVAMGR